MSDQPPPPPESDADVVLFALKNMGSADYATLAIATGLSKPAISSAITELTKRGLVTGKSGTYSPTEAAASEPATTAKPAKTVKSETPPPPPPPPAKSKKKAEPAKKTAESNDDADAVLAALKNMGSGTYATLATATGLSKPAVSAAITDLTKRDLVTGKAGEYSLTGSTAQKKPAATETKATAKPKPAAAAKKPKPSAKPAAADSDDDADADAVLAALKNMGSGTYATLATATGLSKPAVSAAITDLTKRDLVTGKAGEYSLTGSTAQKKPAASETTKATAKPKPAAAAKKPKPSAKPAAADSDDDAEMVLAALKNMGSGTYATLATATGLSKPAVSAAITDLTKRDLVTGKAGEYSLTDGTAPKPIAKPKAASATKKPTPADTATPAAASSSSLAEELERLTALRDAGALTAAEFTKAKKKLLDTT